MRLSIRAEQRIVVETLAEENFVRRLAKHLLDEYPKTVVILPGDEKFTVDELPRETLDELVRAGIARARSYGNTFESSISAFTAVMFEVSPNFDTHRLCQVLLNDEEVESNNRIDEILNVLTEKNWETIKADYDPNAWKPEEETGDVTETQEKDENKANPDEPKNLDLEATVVTNPVE